MRICIALDSGSSPFLKGLKIAMHASGQKRCENMRENYKSRERRTWIPCKRADFSYRGVACELRTTTNFRANFCK
jgi:hypothetical protein